MNKNGRLGAGQVLKLARLANLSLTKEEKLKFGRQLPAILAYFDLLEEVDTSEVSSTSSPSDLTNVTREDVPSKSESLSSLRYLKTTTKGNKYYFVVKRIL